MKLLESYQDALKIVGINEVEKVGKGDLIWLETPTNPKCEIFDIQKVIYSMSYTFTILTLSLSQFADIAHKAGALLAVDG